MERMRTIPVDLILHELAARLAELPDPQHRDLHLAISGGCIRPQTLAEEWIHGAGVAQQSAWLIRRLDGEDMTAHRLREIAAETRAMEVAVARRLADCAISLLVTQDAEDAATAQTLLQAAQRVVGLPTAKPSAEAAPPPPVSCTASRTRAAHSTGTIRSVTVNGVTQEVKVPVKEGDVISFSEDNKVVVKSRAFKVGDKVRYVRNLDGSTKTPPIGWEGIIESDDGTELPFRVAGPSWPMDDGLPFHFFYPDELDLVTPTA